MRQQPRLHHQKRTKQGEVNLRNSTEDKPAWPSKTAAKEKPARPSDRRTTSSSISDRAPWSLLDPHRIPETLARGASTAMAEHHVPLALLLLLRPPPPAPSHGSDRGSRGLTSAMRATERVVSCRGGAEGGITKRWLIKKEDNNNKIISFKRKL